jgi:hypothetical protein
MQVSLPGLEAVRAPSVVALGEMAIRAQNLQAARPAQASKMRVKAALLAGPATATEYLSTMRCAVAVNVVERQKRNLGFTAARALSTVMIDGFDFAAKVVKASIRLGVAFAFRMGEKVIACVDAAAFGARRTSSSVRERLCFPAAYTQASRFPCLVAFVHSFTVSGSLPVCSHALSFGARSTPSSVRERLCFSAPYTHASRFPCRVAHSCTGSLPVCSHMQIISERSD